MLRNGILSCCLFRGMVRNRIPSVCLYLRSKEPNSELFSLPRNGSERSSERLLLSLFHGREFQAFFSSAEWFEWNSEHFLFRGTAGIPPEQTNCSVYSFFRGIIFLSEIANPRRGSWFVTWRSWELRAICIGCSGMGCSLARYCLLSTVCHNWNYPYRAVAVL